MPSRPARPRTVQCSPRDRVERRADLDVEVAVHLAAAEHRHVIRRRTGSRAAASCSANTSAGSNESRQLATQARPALRPRPSAAHASHHHRRRHKDQTGQADEGILSYRYCGLAIDPVHRLRLSRRRDRFVHADYPQGDLPAGAVVAGLIEPIGVWLPVGSGRRPAPDRQRRRRRRADRVPVSAAPWHRC